MSKYYLPISQQNLPLILACESISPKSFYNKEKWQVNTYSFSENTEIDKAHHDTYFCLYEGLPNIKDNDVLYLEIDTKIIEGSLLKKVNDDIVAYPNTILINSKDCQFFCSEYTIDAKKKIIYPDVKKLSYKFSMINDLLSNNENIVMLSIPENLRNDLFSQIDLDIAIANTNFIDSYQGLYYGLAIGHKFSEVGNEEKALLTFLKNIQTTFNDLRIALGLNDNNAKSNSKSPYGAKSFYNSPISNNTISAKKEEQKIFELINNFKELYFIVFKEQKNYFNELYKHLLTKHNDIMEFSKQAQLTKFLQEAERELYLKKEKNPIELLEVLVNEYSLLSKEGISYQGNFADKHVESFKDLINYLHKNVETLSANLAKNKEQNLSFSYVEIKDKEIKANEKKTSLEPLENRFFQVVLNILSNPNFKRSSKTELLIKEKQALMNSICSFFEERVKTKNTPESKTYLSYVIELRKYVISQPTNFKIENQESEVIKSLACFLMKSEKLEDLHTYLDAKGVKNKLIATIFWCTYNGYAYISEKNITAIGDTKRQIEDYITEFYNNNCNNFLYESVKESKQEVKVIATDAVKSVNISVKKQQPLNEEIIKILEVGKKDVTLNTIVATGYKKAIKEETTEQKIRRFRSELEKNIDKETIDLLLSSSLFNDGKLL